jgi:hypothetical protein
VNVNTGRLSDAIARLLPFIIVAAIVTFAYFWFIQTPLNAFLRARVEVNALQTRLRTAQDAVVRAGGAPSVDLEATMRAFEKQMSMDEKVSDVTAILAKAVLDSAPADQLKEFRIETSDRIKAPEERGRPAPAGSGGLSGPDPRFALFPVSVSYTPVKLVFSSTFEAIANVMWKVRDLPTTVEVRSATLTRGLPLMKMELLIWVYQRGAAASPAPAAPGGPATAPSGPTTAPVGPRVASLMGTEG